MGRFPKAQVKTRRTLDQEEFQRISALKQKPFIAKGVDKIRQERIEGHICAPLCWSDKK